MSPSTPQPFARRLSTRLVAALGIALAASWGPLSLAFRLIEVSEVSASGKPESQRSVRIVLARGCVIETAPRKTKNAQQNSSKPTSENEKQTTERVLNAAPETLESAQSIHFDTSDVPAPVHASARISSPVIHAPVYIRRLSHSSDVVAHPARGPPISVS